MDPPFMNSENNGTSELHRVVLISDEKNLKRSDKDIALSNHSVYYTEQV